MLSWILNKLGLYCDSDYCDVCDRNAILDDENYRLKKDNDRLKREVESWDRSYSALAETHAKAIREQSEMFTVAEVNKHTRQAVGRACREYHRKRVRLFVKPYARFCSDRKQDFLMMDEPESVK